MATESGNCLTRFLVVSPLLCCSSGLAALDDLRPPLWLLLRHFIACSTMLRNGPYGGSFLGSESGPVMAGLLYASAPSQLIFYSW